MTTKKFSQSKRLRELGGGIKSIAKNTEIIQQKNGESFPFHYIFTTYLRRAFD